ncbi:porin [Polluticaenibacter yanchengensis]|uniref:Porin n=1 Tax=Polluticaenibacter yanchengensis TaxID=3014562 RepID=A0ABT4UEX7_9BACT|nr:porin [Chitinophagaceae bacterium LY-5]
MRKAFKLIPILCGISSAALAQDSTKTSPLTVSGSVDAYYRYNFNNTPDGGVYGFNSNTSFANSQNSFQLGMASVKAEYTKGKVDAVIDLGYGTRAEEFSYADGGTLFALKQAYISYNFTDKLKLTAGKWGTHIGYEVLDPQANRNYSMSYMFSYGPFSHTGLKAEYAIDDKHSVMIGIANPTDYTRPEWASTKNIIAQYSYTSDNFNLFANYTSYFGAKGKEVTDGIPSSLNQFGITATATVSDKFSIGYDGTVQSVTSNISAKKESSSWWGSALYFNFDPKPNLGFTLRTEYFNDDKNLKAIGTEFTDGFTPIKNVFQTTLSANIRLSENIVIIPELRYDKAGNAAFVKKDGSAVNNTTTALVAAVFSF